MSVSFDIQSLHFMKRFSSVTRVGPQDFFEYNGILFFVVTHDLVAQAVGKGGVHAKLLAKNFKKPVRIVARATREQFLRDLIAPLNPDRIYADEQQSAILVVEARDRKTKALLIGRNASTLRSLEHLVRRHFPVQEIKVV